MLTLDKIATYRAFDGDIDGYVRSRGRGDSSGITTDEWLLIDRLLTAFHILASGQASEQFAAKTEQELLSHSIGPRVRAALAKLARDSASANVT